MILVAYNTIPLLEDYLEEKYSAFLHFELLVKRQICQLNSYLTMCQYIFVDLENAQIIIQDCTHFICSKYLKY